MSYSSVADKSLDFSVRIVKLYHFLCEERKEFIMSKQLLRCGTSIGANIAEALRGQTTADFASKMNIALKEASETEYWIKLLYRTEYLNEKQYGSLMQDIGELLKMLTSICRTAFSAADAQ